MDVSNEELIPDELPSFDEWAMAWGCAFEVHSTITARKFTTAQSRVRAFLENQSDNVFPQEKQPFTHPRHQRVGTVNEFLEIPAMQGLAWMKGRVRNHPVDVLGNVAIVPLESIPGTNVTGGTTLMYLIKDDN